MYKYLTRIGDKSAYASRVCSDKIDVFWNRKSENFVAYCKGKIIHEFLVGESFNVNKIKQQHHKRKSKLLGEEWNEAKKNVDQNLRKERENEVEIAKYCAEELRSHVQDDFVVTDRSGRKIIIKTHKKKNWHYPSRRMEK